MFKIHSDSAYTGWRTCKLASTDCNLLRSSSVRNRGHAAGYDLSCFLFKTCHSGGFQFFVTLPNK